MIGHDVCKNLIHSGVVTGFSQTDYIDLAPMLWSRLPRSSWLKPHTGECLRDALEQNLYIAETPDKRRKRQLYSHVRIAISANIYTSLEARYAGDFPANIEAELASLHGEDLKGIKQHNRSIRYRIEPDADLPDDTVKYRFGVAIYVRGLGEKARWHIRFNHLGGDTAEDGVIPLHGEETTVLVGQDLYKSSYAFRNWPLSKDAQLLIAQKQQGTGAQVTLKAVSGIAENGIQATADGWTIIDMEGNSMAVRYTPVEAEACLQSSHTQMDAEPGHSVFFQPVTEPVKYNRRATDKIRPTEPLETQAQEISEADCEVEGVAAACQAQPDIPKPKARNVITMKRPPIKGSTVANTARKPSGIIVRGIALHRAALSRQTDGLLRLPLHGLMPARPGHETDEISLLLDHRDSLLLEHNGQTATLNRHHPITLPGLDLQLFPAPAALQDDYLGWLALPQALLLSDLTDPGVFELDTRKINQTLAQHRQLSLPALEAPQAPVAAQFQHHGNQVALKTGARSSSYLLPQREKNNAPVKGHLLPPNTTVVRDKAAAFMLICSQYVLEYRPPVTSVLKEA